MVLNSRSPEKSGGFFLVCDTRERVGCDAVIILGMCVSGNSGHGCRRIAVVADQHGVKRDNRDGIVLCGRADGVFVGDCGLFRGRFVLGLPEQAG